MFDAEFIAEVVSLALEIARLQRGQDHLQSSATLYQKFLAERDELTAAEIIWDEIPDVVYYATCLIAWGENYALSVVEQELLPKYQVSIQEAKSACLAKYRLRAAGNPKNFEKERAAVLAAIGKEP